VTDVIHEDWANSRNPNRPYLHRDDDTVCERCWPRDQLIRRIARIEALTWTTSTDIIAIEQEAAAAERERCIAALQQEGQNVLDSGIRPSEPELSAWNYVGKHFRDNAAAILEAPSDD